MAFYHTACFVITVMVVCNAILYPTIFSSIFRRWFGEAPPKPEKESVPDYPPHMRPNAGVRGGAAGRLRPNPGKPSMSGGGGAAGGSSGGVDPSSFMGQQAQESKGRGMMGTVLPVYAVGIFIYFGYVIYKVFLRDKPSTPSTRPTWGFPDNVAQQEGPTLQRQQQESLQRKLAAELKAANYPELKKSDKRAAEVAATVAAATVAATGDSSNSAPAGSTEEVDMLKKRLEETEKTMQRMMDMMNSMGVAMSQVSHHLSNDKSGSPTLLPGFSEPKEVDDHDIEDDDLLDIDVDNLSDEEDLIIGDSMDPCGSSDEENDVSTTKDDMDDDVERRRPNKMNIVDVEADDYHDDDDDDDGDVDSDDESEVENIGVEDALTSDTLRRRNVKGGDSAADGSRIEG
ncbi:resistance to inhibitors of cholinesterase protein 3-like isoform X2 [Strongylocentrotus purpuratus]|uniref:Resistance to inhibitors of cholinesterase protein 3 N-terminal domain-containing protein n=1 Tax=Strongylocentrotus purpuratus TaxID=7668 RepID=A0A7M7PAT4_STRPU|nr:resistance to inhibitors of cholinesterase protein 3-like isoform X2 [Strongylocentrotus purpuratus]